MGLGGGGGATTCQQSHWGSDSTSTVTLSEGEYVQYLCSVTHVTSVQHYFLFICGFDFALNIKIILHTSVHILLIVYVILCV